MINKAKIPKIQFGIRFALLIILVLGMALAAQLWYSNLQSAKKWRKIEAAFSQLESLDQASGVELIRVVNALHNLGRDDALDVLARFLKEHEHEFRRQQILADIVPLLFGRKDPEDLLPSPTKNGFSYELIDEEWTNRLTIEDDIPFQRFRIGGSTISSCRRNYLLDWASNCGQFRETPLTPGDSPLEAAERLFARDTELNEAFIKEQVLQYVRHMFPKDKISEFFDRSNNVKWSRLKQSCNEFTIFWDKERQRFMNEKAK